jgi:NADH-quinone oxidoreductase subunit N
VFTGAAAEVGAILAVASKAAAIGLTMRLVLSLFSNFPIIQFRETIGVALGATAILTATFGNVVALTQNNLKRILAFSTIAHAGVMVLGVACMNVNAASAVLFYLVGYLPMTVGAFAVVAFLRNATGSEELSAARGLLARSPVLAVAMAVFLFGLLGLPPLAGFAGKYQIFSAVYGTGLQHTLRGHHWLGTFFFVAMGAGILNSVIAAGYYLKVLKAVGLDEPESNVPFVRGGRGEELFVLALAAATLAVGIMWDPIHSYAWWAASGVDR